MNCPVCQLALPQILPPFCPQCAWNLGNDPTLNTFLTQIPQKIFSDYQDGLKIAKKNWECVQNAKKEKVYRLCASEKHFYTMDESEKDTLLLNHGFKYEGIAFYAYPNQEINTLPIFRFYNRNTGCHFYTLDEAEKDVVIQNSFWAYEGIAFYAHSNELSQALPVHRFHNDDTGCHFYTLDIIEINSGTQNCNWVYEKVAFYAPTDLSWVDTDD